jgi:hypothetical protein
VQIFLAFLKNVGYDEKKPFGSRISGSSEVLSFLFFAQEAKS